MVFSFRSEQRSCAGSSWFSWYWLLFVFYILELFCKKDGNVQKMLLSCVGALIPLAALVVLWRGLSPDSEVRRVYLNAGLYFRPGHLSLYLVMLEKPHKGRNEAWLDVSGNRTIIQVS